MIFWVLPIEDKPIKIVYEDNICPVDASLRCRYAECDFEDMNFIIKCSNYNKESCDLTKELYKRRFNIGKIK